MTAQPSAPVSHAHSYPVLAWTAVVLTPVAWAVGAICLVASGEGQGEGLAAALLGLFGLLVTVAAPTAAVMLSTEALLNRQRSGLLVLAVSVLALVVTLVAMPRLLASGVGWLVSAGAVVVALTVFAGMTASKRR